MMQKMKMSRSRSKRRIPISLVKSWYWIYVYPDLFKPDTYEAQVIITPVAMKYLENKLRSLGASEHDIFSISLDLTGDLMDVLREKYGHLIRWMKFLPENGEARLYIRFIKGLAKTMSKEQVKKLIMDAIDETVVRIWEKWRNYFKKR